MHKNMKKVESIQNNSMKEAQLACLFHSLTARVH